MVHCTCFPVAGDRVDESLCNVENSAGVGVEVTASLERRDTMDGKYIIRSWVYHNSIIPTL